MASDSKAIEKKSATKALTPEEIYMGFQNLRTEQRSLTSKLSEFEVDLSEHKLVIETLKNVNEDRKCYRLIGGILTEQKVKEVLTALVQKKEKLEGLITIFNDKVTKKGAEINEYREKHNIKFQGTDNSAKTEEPPVSKTESRGNVLVS